jgi:hypothetical protein
VIVVLFEGEAKVKVNGCDVCKQRTSNGITTRFALFVLVNGVQLDQ